MIHIINKLLPIILLISLGALIRWKQFLSENTIDELRKLVVNFALPAVLFLSFLKIELKISYAIIFALMFLLCILLFMLGRIIGNRWFIQFTYFPYLMTGFEYGMLAISLFGAAYGLDNIAYIAVVDLGHEIFIWFVFLPLLLMKRDGVQKPAEILKAFLSAPVVVAIIASLLINALGMGGLLYEGPLVGGGMATLEFLSRLTVPLILIIVGYSVKFDREGVGRAMLVSVMRLGLMIPIALVLNHFIIKQYLQLDPFFEIAVFTLLIMPPPFIVPLYARADLELTEKHYINNVLTIHTIFSVILFLIYFVLHPSGSL